MNQLADIQQHFLNSLLTAEAANEGSEGGIRDFIDERYLARLQIYSSNVITGITNYLREVYPVFDKLVGTAFFDAVCQRFLTQTPPEQGDIHLYGAELADFVDHFEPLAELPYMGDLVRLEWHHHRAYYALQHPSLDLTMEQSQLLESRPVLNGGVQLVRSAYPIDSIWQQVRDDAQTFSVDLKSGPANILVFRFQQQVNVWSLNEAAVTLLEKIQSGSSLGEAIELAMATDGGEQLPEFLSQCLQQSILCREM